MSKNEGEYLYQFIVGKKIVFATFCMVYFTVLSSIKPFVETDVCLKGLRTAVFQTFEPFCANGHVGTIPTQRIY